MTYDDLIKYYGTPTKAGEAIGLKHPRQTLYNWRSGGVPLEQQLKYETNTAGKLKADLPKETRKVIAGKAA